MEEILNNMSAAEIAAYVNTDDGLGRLRGNKALYKRMLGLFKKSEEFGAFEKALADGDTPAAANAMHSIKGIAGNLSLDRLFELSSELMGELRDGIVDSDHISAYRECLETTNACIDEIAEQLG